MSIFFSWLFILLAIFFLFKSPVIRLMQYSDSLPNWRPFVGIGVLLSVIFFVLAMKYHWQVSAFGMICLFLSGSYLIKSAALLFAEQKIRYLNQKIMQHYYLWMIPFSVAFLGLGIFLLTRDYIGPVPATVSCDDNLTHANTTGVTNLNDAPRDNITFFCGVNNPEDLALTPDKKFILLSEFAGLKPVHEMAEGQLKLFNLEEQSFIDPIFITASNEWGDPSCKKAQGIGPHGIDLIHRDDGLYQLAIVSHYPRESIEFYQLDANGNNWQLTWKGCVLAPKNKALNDVTLDGDGSFYTTFMFPLDTSIAQLILQLIFKNNSGHVLKWTPKQGYTKIPNSAGAFPNGITLNRSSDTLYVMYNIGDKISAIDLKTNQVTKSISINSPDNAILQGNSLWVISLNFEVVDAMTLCDTGQICPLPFSIHELDAKTLQTKNIYPIHSGKFGFITVALPIHNQIWMGTFSGDRLGMYRLP